MEGQISIGGKVYNVQFLGEEEKWNSSQKQESETMRKIREAEEQIRKLKEEEEERKRIQKEKEEAEKYVSPEQKLINQYGEIPKKETKQTRKPKRKTKATETSDLPIYYQRNKDLICEVQDFIYKELEIPNLPKENFENTDLDVNEEEFVDLQELVTVFDEISDDILQIKNKEITKGKVKKGQQKIRKLKKLYSMFD